MSGFRWRVNQLRGSTNVDANTHLLNAHSQGDGPNPQWVGQGRPLEVACVAHSAVVFLCRARQAPWVPPQPVVTWSWVSGVTGLESDPSTWPAPSEMPAEVSTDGGWVVKSVKRTRGRPVVDAAYQGVDVWREVVAGDPFVVACPQCRDSLTLSGASIVAAYRERDLLVDTTTKLLELPSTSDVKGVRLDGLVALPVLRSFLDH